MFIINPIVYIVNIHSLKNGKVRGDLFLSPALFTKRSFRIHKSPAKKVGHIMGKNPKMMCPTLFMKIC